MREILHAHIILFIVGSQIQNMYPCELVLNKVHEKHGFIVNWSDIREISKKYSNNKKKINNCETNKLTNLPIRKLQNIFGAVYVWNHYMNEEGAICYELIQPKNGYLYDDDHFLFQCVLDVIKDKKASKMNFTHKSKEMPKENKCGSSYIGAEIINNEVVFKDSCGNVIEVTNPD